MNARLWAGLCVLLATACTAQSPPAAAPSSAHEGKQAQSQPRLVAQASGTLPTCSRDQLLGYVPDGQQIARQRQSALPTLRYPFDTELEGHWGFELTLRVDANGAVVCYASADRYGRPQTLTPQRLALIRNLPQWRYAPFVKNGTTVASIVREQIDEEELPEGQRPLPEVPLDQVRIELERTGCYGSCPGYRVEVRGDGRVVYEGGHHVDVEGRHAYDIPAEEVARLVASLRTSDLWSLRPAYRAGITDNPTYVLTLQMGGQKHTIEDYVGRRVGMPRAVSDFEAQVDRVARTSMWLNLASPALDLLEAEGFRFNSKAGADMLARAIGNPDTNDNQALLRLIELGAPLASPDQLMEQALLQQRGELIDALIAGGALNVRGQRDQAKIDAAFHAAIRGGDLATVQKMWEVAGDQPHPSLTFQDVGEDEKASGRRSPVTLLLSHPWRKNRWEGLEIARWLAQRGCDLKAAGADGTTLLHIAADAGDVDFVRYLLQLGLDPSAPGEFGLPPLGSVDNEDVAMLLLEAGSDPTKMDDRPYEFRHYAEENHWARVVQWLRVRGK